MIHYTRHGSRCRKSPVQTYCNRTHQPPNTVMSTVRPSPPPTTLLRSTSPRSVLTMPAASNTLAAPRRCNAAMSLGFDHILAAASATEARLLAREETQQVKARARGAADREQIRRQSGTLLADAQHLLLAHNLRSECVNSRRTGRAHGHAQGSFSSSSAQHEHRARKRPSRAGGAVPGNSLFPPSVHPRPRER